MDVISLISSELNSPPLSVINAPITSQWTLFVRSQQGTRRVHKCPIDTFFSGFLVFFYIIPTKSFRRRNSVNEGEVKVFALCTSFTVLYLFTIKHDIT